MADSPSRHPNADVRMRGFSQRATLQQALAWLDSQLQPLPAERVTLEQAAFRILVEDVVSPLDVPPFARSMMDGFALKANDTYGASSYNRLPLEIVGECLPGRSFAGSIERGQAVRIMTGAPLPDGADAVLPVELTELEGGRLLAVGEVSPGKHVGQRGEDILAGTRVLAAPRRLRPQDVGLLSSIGCGQVAVVRRPLVRIVVTGDELLPAGSRPAGHRIADANGPMLAGLVARDGGVPAPSPIVPDQPEAILSALQAPADVVLVSGGSSVGQEDHVPSVLAEHGELAIHGVAMRPSSPVGLGRHAGRLVFLLPGNPVSCLCAYDFFASRAIRVLAGHLRLDETSGSQPVFPYRSVLAPLRRKLVSAIGRVDYARVQWLQGEVEPLAISGASILSSTTRADGFVVVPGDSEGYPAGSQVEVHLYD